jgi:transposase
MLYVGIDLHKKTIVLCVVNKDRKVVDRQRFHCQNVEGIRVYFEHLEEPFQFVVEATATYEWLVQLLEPLAESWVLANPGKMLVIAKSTKKTDRLDAQVLAEFLALGMVPQAYRPTARQREHRVLVRHRVSCLRRVSRLKCQIRHLAACYNADRPDLLTAGGLDDLRGRADLSGADRFVLQQHLQDYADAQQRLSEAKSELKSFAKRGGKSEQKSREIARSAPGVGEVVSEVVLAELGDVDRFDSIKEVTAYAGLVPSKRESGGKGKELGITKKGSRLLRWVMVEAAWQAVRSSTRWRGVYESLKRRRGGKRAIVAVARRLLGVLASMVRSGQKYRWSLPELRYRERQAEQRKEKRRLAHEAHEAQAARESKEAVKPGTRVMGQSKRKVTAKRRTKATVGV